MPKAEQRTLGRYQIAVCGTPGNRELLTVDTATGKVWLYDDHNRKWLGVVTPLPVPEK